MSIINYRHFNKHVRTLFILAEITTRSQKTIFLSSYKKLNRVCFLITCISLVFFRNLEFTLMRTASFTRGTDRPFDFKHFIC